MERLNRRAAQAEFTSMSYWNRDFSNIMAEAARTWRLEDFAPARRLRANMQGDAIA